MAATTICDTDLHLLKGDVPEVTPGRIRGHEGIGAMTGLGFGVTHFPVEDRVIISCVSSCGRCANCRQGLDSHCLDPEGTPGIGWILGYMIDGTRVEYVRVPRAENSLNTISDGVTTPRTSFSRTVCPPASSGASSTARSVPATSSR